MRRFLEILLDLEPGQWVGADDWSADLTGVPASSWAVLGIAVAAALLIWLTIRSYLREGDVSRRAKLALASVRITAILVVFLALLRPVLTMKKTRTDYSTVAVLIDTSESMSLREPYEAPAQRAALAERLGVAPASLAMRGRLDIARALLTGENGPLARLAEHHTLVLMRFSRKDSPDGSYVETLATWEKVDADATPPPPPPSETSMIVALVIAGVAALYLAVLIVLGVVSMMLRRRRQAGRMAPGPSTFVLVSAAVALLTACIAGVYARNAYRARQAPPVTPTVDTEAVLDVVRQAVGPLTGDGDRTDLARAVQDAIGAEALRQRRIAALVVFSDGRNAPALADKGALRKLRDYARMRRIPLVGICVGDALARPRNLRVASLAMDRYVLRGSLAEAKVVLESRHCDGQSVTVKLYRRTTDPAGGQAQWTDTGVSATVRLTEAGGAGGEGGEDEPTVSRTEVVLPVTCSESGQFSYRAVVEPLEGELILDDNASGAHVTVNDKSTRVLLVSGDAGWEFQYLRNHLLRARVVLSQDDGGQKVVPRYRVSIWQQNADVEFNQEASTGMKLTSLPRTAEEMFDAFDVVLLYDPVYTTGGFDTNFVTLLKDFVGVHGGGLAYIASSRNTGKNLHPDRGGRELFKPLADLLPVVIGQRSLYIPEEIERMQRRAGHRVQLIGDGIGHPVTTLHPEADKGRTIWRILPGIFWSHPVARLKAGTSVLITSSYSGDRLGDPGERDAFPLLAVHRPGRGSVIYLGFDTTWRWLYVGGGTYYRKFWSNIVDFLARDRLMKRQVGITAARVGSTLQVTAKVYDSSYRPLNQPTYPIRIIHTETGRTRLLTLAHEVSASRDGKPSPRYTGTIEDLPPGTYKVTAASDVPADTVADTVVTVSPSWVELEHPQASPATMRTLSDPGGFFPAERADGVVDHIPPGRRSSVTPTHRDLWSIWLTVVVLCTLLLIEWIARKKYNMA